MFTTGKQIAAARALAGISQAELGKAAGFHRNRVSHWEGRATLPRSEPVSCRHMREVLAKLGVVPVNNPEIGVKQVPPAPSPCKTRQACILPVT